MLLVCHNERIACYEENTEKNLIVMLLAFHNIFMMILQPQKKI
jgi:hypothetical protein